MHLAWIIPLLGATSGCGLRPKDAQASVESVAEQHKGRELIDRFGCGSCHTIPGVADAKGRVAPSLDGIAKRSYVGGALPNTQANLIAWVQHPQRIDPATTMPDLGLSDDEAHAVAAYLSTLK